LQKTTPIIRLTTQGIRLKGINRERENLNRMLNNLQEEGEGGEEEEEE
jgi:Tfp pilus assembly protein PilN